MDILKLIKEKRTVRRYKNKPIPKKILNKIIEAGIWGSSLHGFQPWRYSIISDKDVIGEISEILVLESRKHGIASKILLTSSANTILKSQLLIVIYNSQEFVKWVNKFGKRYVKYAEVAELSAISAAIQDMILVAENFGIGSCWLSMPLFCEKKINNILNRREKLIAVVTFGYPRVREKRFIRRSIVETVKFIK
ncbi:MAG: nitroreductase family protein [Candidatus Omnitrophota bacterium]